MDFFNLERKSLLVQHTETTKLFTCSNLKECVNMEEILIMAFIVLRNMRQLLLRVFWYSEMLCLNKQRQVNPLLGCYCKWQFSVIEQLRATCFLLSALGVWGNSCRRIIHSFLCTPFSADGVALGAAASTSQTTVQLIVFVAIMLHKVSYHQKNLWLLMRTGVAEREFWLPTDYLGWRDWEKSPKSRERRIAHEEMCQLHTDFFWS